MTRADPGLADVGEDVVGAARALDEDGQFEHELMRAQAELGSRPTTSLADLAADLSALRANLARAGAERGVRLVASGTNPVSGTSRTTSERRYHAMTEQFGLTARLQVSCGMHVHVSVASEAEAVRVVDGIGPWLPMLSALSSNSPFYAGSDTGYASYRSMLWGQWPTAGPTAAFGDPATYRTVRDQLVALGAAHDRGMIYFDARLSENYPTVEIRVCDVCIDVEDAVALAGLARAIVDHVAADVTEPEGVRVELLRAAAWRAARWGLTGDLVDLSAARPRLVPAEQLLAQAMDALEPMLQADADGPDIVAGVALLRDRGTGAERQRAAFARRGRLDDVLQELTVASPDVPRPP